MVGMSEMNNDANNNDFDVELDIDSINGDVETETNSVVMEAEDKQQKSLSRAEQHIKNKTEKSYLDLPGGYGEAARKSTTPDDWRYIQDGRGAIYIDITDPGISLQSAIAMDMQIPKKFWEFETDDEGNNIMKNKHEKLRIPPSRSHLAHPQYRIKGLVSKPKVKSREYVNEDGDRFINTWRPLVPPPRPAEQYFKIVDLVLEWVDMMWPGWKEWLLDVWAHQYQKLEQKANFCIVLGSTHHGTGKDYLLQIATWVLANQRKVSNVEHDRYMDTAFNEWLKSPIVIVSEFYEPGTRMGSFINKTKTISAAPPYELAVNGKHQPLMMVDNIHRLYFTTNHANKFPKENHDRRVAILESRTTKQDAIDLVNKHIGSDVNLDDFIGEGGGDAFYWWLMERDISKFDPKRIPDELVADFDIRDNGREMNETLLNSLNELTVKVEGWAGRFDVEELNRQMDKGMLDLGPWWPKFIIKESLYMTEAAAECMDDLPERGRGKGNSHIDTIMNNAGYVPVSRGVKSTQWIVRVGGLKYQTTRIYVREDLIAVNKGEKVINATIREEAQRAFHEFVEWQTTTADGKAASERDVEGGF